MFNLSLASHAAQSCDSKQKLRAALHAALCSHHFTARREIHAVVVRCINVIASISGRVP